MTLPQLYYYVNTDSKQDTGRLAEARALVAAEQARRRGRKGRRK